MFKNRNLSVAIRQPDKSIKGFTVHNFDGLFDDLSATLYASNGDPEIATQLLTQQGAKFSRISKYGE